MSQAARYTTRDPWTAARSLSARPISLACLCLLVALHSCTVWADGIDSDFATGYVSARTHYRNAMRQHRHQNYEDARTAFENYVSLVDSNTVSFDLIRAHSMLVFYNSRQGRFEDNIRKNGVILELVEKANARNMYHSRASYLDERLFYLNNLFQEFWNIGRIGKCQSILNTAIPLRDELDELSSASKYPHTRRELLMSRQYGKWHGDRMEMMMHWAAGRQAEQMKLIQESLAEIVEAEREYAIDDRNRLTLQHFSTFLAHEHIDRGEFLLALSLIQRVSNIRFQIPLIQSSTTVTKLWEMELQHHLYGRSEAVLLEMAAMLRHLPETTSPIERIQANRTIGRTLYRAERYQEALHYADNAVSVAMDLNVHQFKPYTFKLRARIHLALGELDKAEADILETLEGMRRGGTKTQEPYLYDLYGKLKRAQGDDASALQTWHTGIQLCRRFNRFYLELDILSQILELHVDLGNCSEAQDTWTSIQALLREHPNIQPFWKRTLEKVEPHYHTLVRTADCAQLIAMPDTETADSSTPAPAPETRTLSSSDGLYIQPAAVTTQVQSNEIATARFLVLNSTTSDKHGELVVHGDLLSCTWRSVSNDTVLGQLDAVPAGAESSPPTSVTVPAGQLLNVYLQHMFPGPGSAVGNLAVLSWTGTNGLLAEWQFSPDADSRNLAIVDASLVDFNPFFHVPFYHSIFYRGGTATLADVRVTASSPCRVEIYEEGDEEPLAIDANGDGDFIDAGDALFVDANNDELPDFSLDAINDIRTIELWVFPAADYLEPGHDPIEISVWIGENGSLRLESVDVLSPLPSR